MDFVNFLLKFYAPGQLPSISIASNFFSVAPRDLAIVSKDSEWSFYQIMILSSMLLVFI